MINETKKDYQVGYLTMSYGLFLKELASQTDLPVQFLHKQMIESVSRLNNNKKYINEKTLKNLIHEFNNRFNKRIKYSYRYEPLNFTSSTSIFNSKNNEFVDDIPANDLGIYSSDSTKDEKYLYDRPPLRYDSTDPELKILKRTYDSKISVFGKLPEQAIKIPRYDKGTTTPDFIFLIKRENKKTIYLVVETKAENMRLNDEDIKINQEKYFNQFKESGIYYRMAISEQEVHDLINKIENVEIKDGGFTI